MDLSGKTALITGGSRGIGRAIGLELAKNNANVIITYHKNHEKATELLEELRTYPVKSEMIAADVSDFEGAKHVVKKILKSFGALDILVNNAGISIDKPFYMLRESDWDTIITTNLKGVFNYSKAVITHFIQRKTGNIINIASVAGFYCFPSEVHYGASKAGVIQLTRSLAKEVASFKIRVNAVAPGFISTDMQAHLTKGRKEEILKSIPLGRYGTVRDIAAAVIFLASDASSYMTGNIIVVDGGMAL